MKLHECKDFSDVLFSVANYGEKIEAASKKVWSAKKYRRREDIFWCRQTYPQHENIIDRLTTSA